MTPPADTAPARTQLLPLALGRAAQLDSDEPVRAWTPLGTVDAGAVAEVDGAGAVQMRGASWILDWWVGAEDRWHHACREAAVRQQALGEAPVVETAMRVPGGDVVHRAYGVRAASGGDEVTWEDSGIVVEVENRTAVPVALAFALRPFALDGTGRVERVEVEGPVVRVDGRVAAVLSRTAPRAAHGAPGTPADLLAEGRDVDGAALSVSGERGEPVEVALVVPLPHAATVRVLLPRIAPSTRRLLRRAPEAEPGERWSAPEAEAIASGWEAHTRAAARVELPEPLLSGLVAPSQRSLLLAAGDELLGEHPALHGHAGRRAAWVTEALARSGLTEPLGPLARALLKAQRLGGEVRLLDGSDATVALLHASGPLLGGGAQGWVDELLGPVAKAIHRLAKRGVEDPSVVRVADALARLAPALRSIEQPEVAEEAQRLAAELTAGSPQLSTAGSALGLAATAWELRDRIRSGATSTDTLAELIALARIGQPGSVPDRVDSEGVPNGALGHDPAAVASRLCAVLDLVLWEGSQGPVLLSGWAPVWWGQPIEAHALRTRWGLASFGVRWHGERPAVLWEIEPASGVDTGQVPVWRAPALDPDWQGSGWSGEALLGPVEVPSTLVSLRAPGSEPAAPPPGGGSFS